MFFEGTEKKVEIAVSADAPKLRGLGRDFWSGIVESAQAQILSEISNDHCDAYLLSESSLFVFDDRFAMITCGKTSLVNAIVKFLKVVPIEQVTSLIYERKNENFPHSQPSHFFDDMEQIKELVPGKAFRFGDEDEHHVFLFHMNSENNASPNDMTLEILMHGVCDEASKSFCSHSEKDGNLLNAVREIIPGFQVDDYFFEPEGYSLNAIKDDEYYTIHVTPQKIGSYVSFETNHRFSGNLEEVTQRVLGIFKPKAYDIVQFQIEEIPEPAETSYFQKRHVRQKLENGFDVHFVNFFRKEDSAESAFELDI